MRQRSLKIIVVLGFFNFSASLNAQENYLQTGDRQLLRKKIFNYEIWMKFSPNEVKYTTHNFYLLNCSDLRTVEKRTITPNIRYYYTQSLGFICRQELKLDQLVPVKFRLRLGSLDHVNTLEGKPNAPGFH
jgi:hypothetical protein